MVDYEISKHIPEFAQNFPDKVQELVTYLKDELGVPDECPLHQVTEKDLLDSKLLKIIAARKLVNGWKNGNV